MQGAIQQPWEAISTKTLEGPEHSTLDGRDLSPLKSNGLGYVILIGSKHYESPLELCSLPHSTDPCCGYTHRAHRPTGGDHVPFIISLISKNKHKKFLFRITQGTIQILNNSGSQQNIVQEGVGGKR